MLEFLNTKLAAYKSNEQKFNFLREYLQQLILKIIEEKNYFQNISFVGGTALRILYDLKRFSEDLDFCLINETNYQFSGMMETLEETLNLYNIDVSIRYKDKKTVASALVKFNNILFLTELSPHEDKKLTIKFEVDQNPPKGYHTQLSMVNKDLLIAINHFDLPSLFAGKLHAVLCRKYTKGRDYYDLLWYLTKKTQPNLDFLNQAIIQTEQKDLQLDKNSLITILNKRIEQTDFKHVQQDIAPFLEDTSEINYFNRKIFLEAIENLR